MLGQKLLHILCSCCCLEHVFHMISRKVSKYKALYFRTSKSNMLTAIDLAATTYGIMHNDAHAHDWYFLSFHHFNISCNNQINHEK